MITPRSAAVTVLVVRSSMGRSRACAASLQAVAAGPWQRRSRRPCVHGPHRDSTRRSEVSAALVEHDGPRRALARGATEHEHLPRVLELELEDLLQLAHATM